MMISYLSGKIILILFMIICAISDIRTKSIDIRIFIAMYIVEFIWYMYANAFGIHLEIASLMIGASLGIFLIIISKISRGAIGIGDGMFFIASGIACGSYRSIYMFICTMTLSAICSLFIIMWGIFQKKSMRGKQMPLIPLTIPAYIWMMI